MALTTGGIWYPGAGETFAPPSQGLAAWLQRFAESVEEPEVSAQTWTPTFTNLTVGNGSFDRQHYRIAGGVLTWELGFLFGSTTTVSSTVSFTLPQAAAAGFWSTPGSGYLARGTSPTGRTSVVARMSSSTAVGVWYDGGSMGATSPFSGGTWASGDRLTMSGSYVI